MHFKYQPLADQRGAPSFFVSGSVLSKCGDWHQGDPRRASCAAAELHLGSQGQRGSGWVLLRCGLQSKRVPSRTGGKFDVADVVAEPKPEAGTDRHHDDIFIGGGKRRHAKARHDISGTSNAIKLFVYRVSAR